MIVINSVFDSKIAKPIDRKNESTLKSVYMEKDISLKDMQYIKNEMYASI